MSSTDTLNVPATPSRSPFSHPRGLYVLFGAEMWERLSYYGMRALLVLYLTSHLNYKRADALNLYAIYTGLVYLTPLLGGYLADRVLGQRKAVFVGGMLMALGHFAMAFEPYLYLALGLIILGNGFFKPNISTMVGELYARDDTRRDSAYTIFYMGINLGAFIAPLICGTLGESERFGWHWGFGAAGVGMCIGLISFGLFQGWLGDQGFPPDRVAKADRHYKPIDFAHILIVTALGAVAVYAAVTPAPWIDARTPAALKNLPLLAYLPVLAYWSVLAAVLAALTIFVAGGRTKPAAEVEIAGEEVPDRSKPFSREEWQRIAVILIVGIFSIIFWMGFEQAGGTFNLFAKEKTDRTLPAPVQKSFGSQEFPASWYQSINPLLIVVFAPFPLMFWAGLEKVGFRVNSAAKMGLGLVILGLGFVVMDYIDQRSTPANKAGPHWLVIVYLFNTIGELCLSPIGLSLVNKLAPAKVASLMMATWFLCTAIANYLAGIMEEYLHKHAPNLHLFTFLIWTSIVAGLLLLVLNPLLKKMSHGRL